jgi:xylulokinase
MGLLLGIDLGSSAVKATLVCAGSGRVAATLSAQTALHSSRPGWAEADADEWWSNTCALIPALLAAAGARADEVLAVATTGMVPAVVCVDAAGTPLRPALLQNDARATAEIGQLRGELSALDLVALTGSALTQQSVAPTLRWLERHEPGVHRATAAVVGSYDWLLERLGAGRHVEENWALESGLYLLDGRPCAEVLAAAHWLADRLVPVHRPGDVVGQVSVAAAAATGLREGTPLVVGGADHVLSAYAAGLQRPGQLLVKLGGAGDILAVASGPVVDRRLYLDRHPAPGWFMPNGCMATSGTLLRWFQRELADGAGFDVLDAEAEDAGAGAGGLVCLPYMLGEKSPIHDADARGAFIGLHLGHTRGHLFRACLEATGYGFRQHLDVLAEIGLRVEDARVSNGGARSALWKQVVADICGIPLRPVLDHPGASLGAAVAAGIGVGAIAGWDAMHDLVRVGGAIEPTADPAARAAYERNYSVYRELWPAVAPLVHRLAREEAA